MKTPLPAQQCPICLEEITTSKITKHILGHNKGGNKYNARKVEIDGYVFDSKMEGSHYLQLKTLAQAGLIRDLEMQPAFICKVNEKLITRYTADFRYYDVEKGKVIIEDVKGKRTEAYVIRRKLTQALFNIEIVEVTKDQTRR